MAISEVRNSMLIDVSTAEPVGRRWRRALGPDQDGYGFVLPAAIIMTALIVYPFCLALWFSLSDGMIGETRHWIGLQICLHLAGPYFPPDHTQHDYFAVSSVVLKSIWPGSGPALQRAAGEAFLPWLCAYSFVAQQRSLRWVGGSSLIRPIVISTGRSHIWPLNLLGLGSINGWARNIWPWRRAPTSTSGAACRFLP